MLCMGIKTNLSAWVGLVGDTPHRAIGRFLSNGLPSEAERDMRPLGLVKTSVGGFLGHDFKEFDFKH